MSFWFNPTFVVSVLVTLVGLAAWFIRLESKTNTNLVEVDRLKEQVKSERTDAKKHREDIEATILSHLMDEKRHYNEQFFNEFRSALDARFRQMDRQLIAISNKIDQLK